MSSKKRRELESRLSSAESEFKKIDKEWERHDLHGASPNPMEKKMHQVSDEINRINEEIRILTQNEKEQDSIDKKQE